LVHNGAGFFFIQTVTPAQTAATHPVGQTRVAAFIFFLACLRVFIFLPGCAAGAACVEACGADDAAAMSAAQAGAANIKALNSNSMYFMVTLPFWLKNHSWFSGSCELPASPVPEIDRGHLLLTTPA
jgi:hypothetical protein